MFKVPTLVRAFCGAPPGINSPSQTRQHNYKIAFCIPYCLFPAPVAILEARPVRRQISPDLIGPHKPRAELDLGKGNHMNRNGTRTILVIEDYADSRQLLSSLLRANGYKVVEARDGREGLLQAYRVTPDLILMDLAMPEMDGVAATRHLRQRQSLARIPIFVMTAYGTSDVKQDALAAGCAEVFAKPLEIEMLLGRIRETLGA